MKLEGATFIVTGGGSGLGEATARAFAEAGARVAILDVQEERGKRVAEEIGGQFFRVDVTDEDAVRAAVDEAAEGGVLRGAVNCAGIATAEKILSKRGVHSLESFARVIQVNLVGTFNVMRLVAARVAEAPALEDGERGVIINTASIAAYEGQIGQAAYSASKGGIVGLTLPAARELAAYGIRVVAIAPGIFETPLLMGLPEAARQSLGQQVPFPQRLGRPREYALLARHIVENPMLNGEVIRLDGALRMQPR
ncbi:3-hydroxyacyl-CoA dehydrogenase [Alicyclobacillus acidocaldarius]|uniref:Short-chain dehydrogenase/reductase SDR n=1 Tax=Alicyclobacillus acidocaldarius subsp. acidocaldarius (strain ATCC 27009 / DSM 446 / BCRC 14685 / JCM 5260 / KCTC 1825 / NBRC 15652 / NCIMB 11725 / NRRL B-14509 / 104-IA) TaxID=521098 RepID=C8WWL2_ALIAD|nr:3-hydroxyacyl-CoA dehydrogenase [Alicyclobacillus acidocaldarius]ACV58483.1 short-chain dehydrogenase/reductase SDR [Alicyclobacillus acidocaldarius subsp. acidocaldarius DSM 446]